MHNTFSTNMTNPSPISLISSRHFVPLAIHIRIHSNNTYEDREAIESTHLIQRAIFKMSKTSPAFFFCPHSYKQNNIKINAKP